MKGKFITIEGTEGVGKSTNLEFIKSKIEARGLEVVVTREPGGTPLAEELRKILLAKREESFDPLAELLVVFAARSQHIREVILPALQRGCWVLSDRFTDATYAYQGYGRGLSVKNIVILEKLVQQGLQPDATFYLDIDVKLGLERAAVRADLDRFEEEKVEFFEKVRSGYLTRIKAQPARFIIVDASRPLHNVQKEIAKKIDQMFSSHISMH